MNFGFEFECLDVTLRHFGVDFLDSKRSKNELV